MNTEALKATLQTLKEQLRQADDLDPELVELLQQLDARIHEQLAAAGSDAEPADASPLLAQAQELDARLAAKHPQLEALFRELVNALARMGI